MNHSRYLIHGGIQGSERLELLNEVMGPTTLKLLSRINIKPGSACLDVGCGTGETSITLAKIIGPNGYVKGIDFDDVKLEMAITKARQSGLNNITFDSHNILTWDSPATFDVIYLRFILTHLENPDAILQSLKNKLRPKGTIIIEDIDFRGHFSEPSNRAMDAFIHLYSKAALNRGTDPNIGSRLPTLLHTMDFLNVDFQVVQPVSMSGGIKSLTQLTLENISDSILQDGLMNKSDLEQLIQDFHKFTSDPTTLIGGPRIFQVWAQLN